MHQVIAIFRKDLKHLWPQAVVVWLLSGANAWMHSSILYVPVPVTTYIWLLGCVYLTVSLIQQEPLPGDRQYWLTRPIGRWHLLASKLLFLVVVLGIPRLIAQATALRLHGVTPLHYSGTLISDLVVFLAAICLVAAAFGAITRNLIEFVWPMLAFVGLVFFVLNFGYSYRDVRSVQWGGLEWVRTAGTDLIAFAGAAAILWLQYARRMTIVARCASALLLLAIASSNFAPGWRSAFALQAAMADNAQVPPSIGAISFRTDCPSPCRALSARGHAPGEVELGLPIRISGIPPNTRLVCERVATSVAGPGGVSWNSGWSWFSTIPHAQLGSDDEEVLTNDGNYWLNLSVDDATSRAAGDRDVHLHAKIAFTMLGSPVTVPLEPGKTGPFAGDGICRTQAFGGNSGGIFSSMTCGWPGRPPARSYLHLRSTRTGHAVEYVLSPRSSYGPSLFGPVWTTQVAGYQHVSGPIAMELETWQALAYFERELDIPAIRLNDYGIARP